MTPQPPQPQPQVPDWATFSQSLPKDIPDDAYNALRERYFNENVAPESLKLGYGLDTVHKQFMSKTERPGKSNWPRAALVAKEAQAEAMAPWEGLAPGQIEGARKSADAAAQEAAGQGINPTPYQFAGGMLGQLPYWGAGMGMAGEAVKAAEAGPLMEKAIKTAAGGIIQGSYDLAKTGRASSGMEGALTGAGIMAGFEALGPLKNFLMGKGMGSAEADAVQKVAKGLGSPGDWDTIVKATLEHGRLDDDIAEWVGNQAKAAKQAGVAQQMIPDFSMKGLSIDMVGADGQPYNLKSPTQMQPTMDRIAEHLKAGGSIEQITGTPKQVSQFYQMLTMSDPKTFDLSLPIKDPAGKPSTVSMPSTNDAALKPKAGMDLHELINARNSVYHATDEEGFRGILEAGRIGFDQPDEFLHRGILDEVSDLHPDWSFEQVKAEGDRVLSERVGVSVSRTPRVSSKANKAITFVLDQSKMPKTRPYVEEGYEKTVDNYAPDLGTEGWEANMWVQHQKYLEEGKFNEATSLQSEIYGLKQSEALKQKPEGYTSERNQLFEFENRTRNEPVPLSAVRGIVVDRAALSESINPDSAAYRHLAKAGEQPRIEDIVDQKIEEIKTQAAKQNLTVKVMESGRDVHSYRAGLSKQPSDMRWGIQSSDIPTYDQLETLGSGQVVNKLTGKIYDNIQDALIDHASSDKANSTELVRGSANIPLDERGQATVDHVGERLATKGGLDKVVTSDTIRTQQTTDAILKANPKTSLEDTTPMLQSWASGSLEGAEHTPEISKYKADLAENFPDHQIGGMGDFSSRMGESFNNMKMRVLPYVRNLVQEMEANPEQKIGVVTHFSPIRLVESWVKAGLPDDFSLDPKDFTRERAQPAGVYKLFKSEDTWKMRKVNLENDQQLQPGIYFIRHGETAWNKGGDVAKAVGEQPMSDGLRYKETPLTHRFIGQHPEEVVPENAGAATVSAGPGNKPSIFYRDDTNKELIFHENLHGHYSYLGLSDWIHDRFGADPMVHDIFHGAFSPEAKALYGTPQAEEIFNYAASAVRTGNDQLLTHFGDADTSKEAVLDWTADVAKEINEKASEAPDSLHKRTLERRLGSVVSRASGMLEDVDRLYATSPMKLDLERGQYVVREGDSADYFDDRGQAVKHMESQYQEPLQAPELVPTQSVPDNTPRYALKVPAPTNKPPSTSDPLPADLTPQPLKAGTFTFSYFFRPFYDWLSAVSEKFDRPDLYSAFSAVDGKLIEYQNALRPFTDTLKQSLIKFPERQQDFLKWIQAGEEHRGFVEQELHFKPEEVEALHRYDQAFLGEFPGLKEFLTDDMEKLRNAGYDPKTVWPKGKAEGMAAELVSSGRIDPRELNLMKISSVWMRSHLHSSIVEPVLKEAEELTNAKIGGKDELGQLAPLLRRHLAYLRGTPDMTGRAIQGALEATVESINQGIEKVNSHLPDSLQMPQIGSPPQDLLQRYIMLSYAGALAARPGVLARASLQTFITGFPLMGNYIWKGMARSFEVAKEGVDSDAWKIAEKHGIFIEKASLQEMLAGGSEGLGWEDKLADKALKMIQWSHNSSRLVSFWGHAEKAMDALREHADNPEAFSKASDLWFMPEGMRAKYLKELPNVGPDGYEDLSRRIGADLTGLTQWNYRKGANPGLYKWQLGRLFGQYGTWPLNYIEYARRFASGSDKTASMQALARLVVAHGAVMSAGATAGVDTHDWVFASPMAWGGGPMLQATVGLPSAAGDWSSPRGAEARQELLDMVNPMNLVPGAEEAHEVWNAVASHDPNLWVKLLGFKPER